MTVPFTPHNFSEAALVLTVRIDTDFNGVQMTGTGFLCQVMDGNEMSIALVSNRHVFRDGNGSIELRFHRATATKQVFDLGDTIKLVGSAFTHRYVPHPNANIDLAAAIVNAVGMDAKGLMIGAHQIATAAELEDVLCGDPVWFVGYPDSWRDELHNLPLMRRGWVSSLPRLPFDGKPEFIIDAQAFPGSSGSPVFVRADDEVKLVGVLAETGIHPSPVVGASPSLGALTVNEVAGLGIVIRSTEIPALLDEVRVKMAAIIAGQRSP